MAGTIDQARFLYKVFPTLERFRFVLECLFGIGKLVFGQWFWGLLLLVLAAVSGYLIFWDLSRRGWETLSGKESVAERTVARV